MTSAKTETAVNVARECLALEITMRSGSRDKMHSVYDIEYQMIRLLFLGLSRPTEKAFERLDNFRYWLKQQQN